MPALHVELIQSVLDRQELVDATQKWMAHHTSSHAKWQSYIKEALKSYGHTGYANIKRAFEASPDGAGDFHALAIAEAFAQPWIAEHALPEGMLLLRGDPVIKEASRFERRVQRRARPAG
jgi:hypothetical protein